MLLMLQGSAPEALLAQNLNYWRNLITGEEVAYEPNSLLSSIWSAAEGQPSWVARGILLHLALHRARPWPTDRIENGPPRGNTQAGGGLIWKSGSDGKRIPSYRGPLVL